MPIVFSVFIASSPLSHFPGHLFAIFHLQFFLSHITGTFQPARHQCLLKTVLYPNINSNFISDRYCNQLTLSPFGYISVIFLNTPTLLELKPYHQIICPSHLFPLREEAYPYTTSCTNHQLKFHCILGSYCL